MKRQYIVGSALIFSVMLMASCKKALEIKALDRIGEDIVWANKTNAETFIFSTYGIMNSFAGGPQTDPRTLNTIGFDDIYNGNQAVFTERIDRTTDAGFNNWAAIRRCNQIITKVASSAGISDADKKSLVAEGKFLRAMSYYNVARNIGRIVWIDQVLPDDADPLFPSTANPTESYNFIIKDLEDAIQDLPSTKIPGRANKYTAAAFLTEVCLEALAYKNYPAAANVNPSDPLLDKIISNAQIVIDGGYSLEPDYGQMFTNEKPTSNEIIFGIYRKATNTSVGSTPMQLYTPLINKDRITPSGGTPLLKNDNLFLGWVQHGPTQNIANDYLVIDKQDPSKAVRWDQTSQYLNAIDETMSIPTNKIPLATGEISVKRGTIKAGSSETIWSLNNVNRDARWYSSITSDSTLLYGETITTCYKGNATRWMKINFQSQGGYYVSLTNMYWRKGMYTNVSPSLGVDNPTDYHYVPTRLGRVLLNLAEAYLLKGDLANALLNFNRTRIVHGKLPAATASNLTNAWADYKRERRVDLVLENDYYWSLLRWGRYGGDANSGRPSGDVIPELTEVPLVMDISKDRTSYSVVEGSFFGQNNLRLFDKNRRYLFPIPQTFLDRNTKFGPQNTGW